MTRMAEKAAQLFGAVTTAITNYETRNGCCCNRAARISNCSPETTADADRERMERERSMMVSLARGAEQSRGKHCSSSSGSRVAVHWAFIRAMVLAPLDWRSERIEDRSKERATCARAEQRPSSFLIASLKQYSQARAGAPPSRAAAVAKTIRNGSRDFSFSSPPSSLFASFPTYLSIAERARGRAKVSLASLDATAAAIPRSCRRNFTCFEWRGPIEGPGEGRTDAEDGRARGRGRSGETRVHLRRQEGGQAGRLLKTNMFRRSCLRLVCMVPPTVVPEPRLTSLRLRRSRSSLSTPCFERDSPVHPSIRVMSCISPKGRSHFTSPPACPLSSPVSLDSLPSLRYNAHPPPPSFPSFFLLLVSRFPNLAPESSIHTNSERGRSFPSSSSSLDDDDTG